MGIHRSERFDCLGIVTADQHTIRLFEIGNGRSFRQELGIGEHRKGGLVVRCSGIPLRCLQNRLNGGRRAHGQGALFHHDGVAAGVGRHRAGRSLHPAQITGLPGTQTFGFGGGVHRQEDHVGGSDGRLHLGAEKQIAPAAAADHRIQSGLVHRQAAQIGIIPSGDALGIEVHHRHLDARAAIGNHGHGGPTHIARTDAANRADGWDAAGHAITQKGACKLSEAL